MEKLTLADAERALADVPKNTRAKFLKYHMENPQIWPAFEKFALQVLTKRKRMGAKAIAERVRYEIEIEQDGEFKLNNSYISYFGRIFMHKYKCPDFFETRAISGLEAA